MTKENNITLKYGDGEIEFNIDENNIISTLHTNRIEPLKEPSNRLEQLLERPIQPIFETINSGKESPKDFNYC